MRDNPTVEGFIDFVSSQPADKCINHSSWATCAIGEYLECDITSRADIRAARHFAENVIPLSMFNCCGRPNYGAMAAAIKNAIRH